MEKEDFIYDGKYSQYEAKINNIEFYINKLPTKDELKYIKEILKNYKNNLYKIANFLLDDNNFKNFFNCNNISVRKLIEKLNSPVITIISQNEATLTYTNHTLDDMHIILFDFIGMFEKLANISIDG